MTVQTKRKHKHDDRVSEVIDRVLRQIFGPEARLSIYKYLETRHSLKQDEITEKIDVFAEGLKEYLSSGAYTVEAKILEELNSSSGSIQRLQPENGMNESDFPSQIRMFTRTRENHIH